MFVYVHLTSYSPLYPSYTPMARALPAQLAEQMRSFLSTSAADAPDGGGGGVSVAWLEGVRGTVLTAGASWPLELLTACATQAQAQLKQIWTAMGFRVLASAREQSRREMQAEATAAAQVAKDEADRRAMAAGDQRREARLAHAEAGQVPGSETDAARLAAEVRAFEANEEAYLERALQKRLARQLNQMDATEEEPAALAAPTEADARAQWAMLTTLLRLGALAATALPVACRPRCEAHCQGEEGIEMGLQAVKVIGGVPEPEDEGEEQAAPPLPPPPGTLVLAALARPLEQQPPEMEAWSVLCEHHASHATAARKAWNSALAEGSAAAGRTDEERYEDPDDRTGGEEPPLAVLDRWLEALALLEEEEQ